MRVLIPEEDFKKAVIIIKNEISTQLINRILDADLGKECMEFLLIGDKKNKEQAVKLLIEEKGTELLSDTSEEIIGLREQLLRSVPEELVMELYNRHPTRGKNIKKVGYMYKELSKHKWFSGGSFARDFVKAVDLPEIFSGVAGGQAVKKKSVEEIFPKIAVSPLKDYQIEIKRKLLDILNGDSNNRCCMISLPTGGGKTRVAVEAFLEWMQRRFDENKYLVWVAQSEELCEQCISCVEQIWRDREFILPLKVYRYFAGYNLEMEELTGGVVVCNIQKIYNQLQINNRDIAREILQHTGAMIIDEAHRASTKMYDIIFREAKTLTDGKLFPVCGLSATPGRTKIEEEGKKLINRFEANLIVPEFRGEDGQYRNNPIQYFKDKKYLSITKHIAYSKHKKYILTEKELQEMGRDENAEFPSVFLKRLAKDKENNTRMIKRILQIPENQSTLVYTCTVEQARWFTIYMLHYGRKAAYIDSDTGRNIRRGIIEKFKKGEIQFLFNYGVLTTGFDAPKVENIVLARPIRSEILYEQIIGRGIRGEAFGGTEFCTIIDFFDNTFIQGLPKSYERFRQYWDIDESGKWIHNKVNIEQSESIKQKIYVMNSLSECPICKNKLEDSYCMYKKNGKDKKLIVRRCTKCFRNYITVKFNESSGFPNDYFVTEKIF